MIDDLAEVLPSDDFAGRQPLFTVHAEPPSLLYLSGELDMTGAPALATALEPLTRCGGTIGLDLAELTFMDSTGINTICEAARQVGERGRIVVFHPTPTVRRVLELTGVIGIIDVSDDPSSPYQLD